MRNQAIEFKRISGATLIIAKTINKLLKKAPPEKDKRMILPFIPMNTTGLSLGFLEDTQVRNEPESHLHQRDVWYCLEGEVEFICGGKVKNYRQRMTPDGKLVDYEFFGDRISSGEKAILKTGDWLWIPPGVPHQHISHKACRLIIIKVPDITHKFP